MARRKTHPNRQSDLWLDCLALPLSALKSHYHLVEQSRVLFS
jgi:hypothetical protein